MGGAVCVLSADLVKCSTIRIRVKDVKQIMRMGAKVMPVKINMILRAPAIVPFPSLYVTVKSFAIFSSFKSSGVSAVPGSRILVRSYVVPASDEESNAPIVVAYTCCGLNISTTAISIHISNPLRR